MILDLTGFPRDPALSLAGSLYAVPAEHRCRAAADLAAAGWWVHVDVILRAGPEGVDAGTGVPPGALADVRAAAPTVDLEVHVIDLTGPSDRAVDPVGAVLDIVLAAGPQRVVLPSARCGPGDTAAVAVRAVGAQLWAECGPLGWPGRGVRTPDVQVGGVDVDGVDVHGVDVDGVLVMLIDPGSTQRIDLGRLAVVPDLPPGLPLGVDGGVGPEHVAPIRSAGAQHLVSGRALLAPGQHEHRSTLMSEQGGRRPSTDSRRVAP